MLVKNLVSRFGVGGERLAPVLEIPHGVGVASLQAAERLAEQGHTKVEAKGGNKAPVHKDVAPSMPVFLAVVGKGNLKIEIDILGKILYNS